MAGNIKGITIEFRGDTTNLSKAINTIRSEAKSLDKELGYIDKALKFDPKNVNLLKQKMALLNEATKNGEKNIDDMKKALAEMKANGISETSAEYRELEREIAIAEGKQKAYNKELKKLQASTSPLGRASQKMKEFGNASIKAGEALRGLSMVAGAVDIALAGLTVKAGKSADELNTMAQVTGISTEELQKYKLSADLLDVSVETIAKSQMKMKKSMLSAQQGSKNIASAFETLGVSIEDSNGHLRNQDEVFAEAIESLGKMENETERDAIAMQIFGKSASELNPLIEDNGETFKKVAGIFAKNNLQIVDQETIDKANQFQDSLDTIKATGMATLSSVGMTLAGYLAPAMEKVADVLGKVMGWLSQLDPKVLTIIGIIAGVVAVLSPVLIVVGKISLAISSIMGLMSTLGISIGALAGTLLPIVGIIAGVIAVGVLLYKNWDTIKEKAIEVKDWVIKQWTTLKTKVEGLIIQLKTKVLMLWQNIKDGIKQIAIDVYIWTIQKFLAIKNGVTTAFNTLKTTVTNVWNGIKTAITHPVETAVSVVKKAIDKIKSFFSNLTLKLPHIKLPHFKLTGSFSLTPPSVPKISIDWYKQGAIFMKPTIFGNGVGVGDAIGGEAVLPLRKLWEEMDKRYSQGVTININAPAGMDVNELAEKVSQKLIQAQKRRSQAWA